MFCVQTMNFLCRENVGLNGDYLLAAKLVDLMSLQFVFRSVSDKCDLPAGCKIQDYIVQETFDLTMVNSCFKLYNALCL